MQFFMFKNQMLLSSDRQNTIFSRGLLAHRKAHGEGGIATPFLFLRGCHSLNTSPLESFHPQHLSTSNSVSFRKFVIKVLFKISKFVSYESSNDEKNDGLRD